MKRIFCVVLALCLMLTVFAGCGKGGMNDNNGKVDNTTDNIEEKTTDLAFPEVIPEPKCLWGNVNINKYNVNTSDKKTDDTYYIYTSCIIKKEYKSPCPVPTKCIVGDTEVVFEVTTVQKFVNSGWCFASKDDENAVQSAHTIESILFKKDDVYVFVSVFNDTDEGMPIGNCTITDVSISYNRAASYDRTWSELLLEGKYEVILHQTTCAEVVKYFGLPHSVKVSEFYYEDVYRSRNIRFEYYSDNSDKSTSTSFIFYQEDGECRLENVFYGAHTF